MTINDGYGDHLSYSEEETFILGAEGWLLRMAISLVGPTDHRLHDVMQEGRIRLWRAWTELEHEPQRIPGSYLRAKRRMSEIALKTRTTPPVGAEGPRRYEPQTVSLDTPTSENGGTLADLVAQIEALDGVEIAYHHGEIQKAIDALTPAQQRYVYARFWCGMDPADGLHMNPGMREARTNNKFLRRDEHWTGRSASPASRSLIGAKQRLAESLSHLSDLVEA